MNDYLQVIPENVWKILQKHLGKRFEPESYTEALKDLMELQTDREKWALVLAVVWMARR